MMSSDISNSSLNWLTASLENISPGRFRLERELGKGARGTAWLFQELRNGDVLRRFVVKYANNDVAVPTIIKEVRFLRQLQGYAHIVQPITENGRLIGPRKFDKAAPEWQKTLLRTAEYPKINLEYMENVSLETFLHRSRLRSLKGLNPVPNRVLWHIFRCLARMVNAMANPTVGNRKFRSENVKVSLEQPRIFDLGTQYQIYHGDLANLQNCIFGDYDSEEHSLVPMIKAIDFGEGTSDVNIMKVNLPGPATAETVTQANILEIGRVMQMLLEYCRTPSFRVFHALRPNIDKDLYALACECAHVDHNKRPSAFRLLERIQTNISKKRGPENFPGKPFAEWESDQKIREYMDEMLKSSCFD